MSKTPKFVPLDFARLTEEEQRRRVRELYELMNGRRTVRAFSSEPVPMELIEWAVRTAGTAPSGAHQQPWRFVVVSDPKIKQRIRETAEAEEKENYERRMPKEWKETLAPFGTDWHKGFLEIAPYLIVVFRIDYGFSRAALDDGTLVKRKHYYVVESVGIAVGLLLTALHHAGLATLTHTPSPMTFLRDILDRPQNETPFLLIPVGYPAEGTEVPDLKRRPLEEILVRVGC